MAAGDKTEKPTPKRLDEARKKGQVARSTDLTSAILLTGATLIMGYWGAHTFEQLEASFVQQYQYMLVDLAGPATTSDIMTLFIDMLFKIGIILLPFFGMGLILAVAANVAQNKPQFSMEAISPKIDKLNPVNGFKRIFSMRVIVETAKSLLKMAVIGGCGTAIIMANQHFILALTSTTPLVAINKIISVIGSIAGTACAIFLVMGFADLFYQRYEHEKQLKMSKQEVKDEHKNQEGDAKMKGKIREIGIQMSRQQQLASVKTADVVITNPTHFAVAIRYDPTIAPAPQVIAKGVDHFALKIREEATKHGVLIQENRPLARALYAMVEVEHLIPPELFVAVAEVLAIVFAKRKPKVAR
jgi:flagellar biosynthetic protein FlhB